MDRKVVAFLAVYYLIFLFISSIIILNSGKKIDKLSSLIKVSISSQLDDKRYIDYYQNISLSSDLTDLPYKTFLLNDYKSFCYCKSKNNTNYTMYDKNACLNLNDCYSNFFIANNSYKLNNIYIWNKKRIYFNQQKYNFYQGIKNGTCDKNFNYKKCGYLIDLNIDFCVKTNKICPFNNISFY